MNLSIAWHQLHFALMCGLSKLHAYVISPLQAIWNTALRASILCVKNSCSECASGGTLGTVGTPRGHPWGILVTLGVTLSLLLFAENVTIVLFLPSTKFSTICKQR